MCILLCFSLAALWKLVENIRRFMNPTTLTTGLRKNFSHSFPEAQSSITHSQIDCCTSQLNLGLFFLVLLNLENTWKIINMLEPCMVNKIADTYIDYGSEDDYNL
jgi:hypothetical protein